MNKFLSCDWGTSSFRLRLVLADSLTVVAEIKNGQGIAATYNDWQQNGKPSAREAFYTNIIQKQISLLNRQVNIPLHDIPVIISGMASSTIGFAELPYKKMPFSLDGTDMEVKIFDGDKTTNPLIIISGTCTDNDVMRGEETKTVGCVKHLADKKGDKLLILPGTHPKHITITGDKATNVKTYMTGEFFDLLATKSVLAASVTEGGIINYTANRESFTNGVKAGMQGNLLHNAFMVRTNQVLKQLPKQQNFHYLSGLLIGAELKGLDAKIPVYLVGGATQLTQYNLACSIAGISVTAQIDADEALIRGQKVIFLKHYGI
ncbi:MAG: hypothetical protein EOP51_15910 [Sphingobacteriales bacterium]|nr:MAG: hypothetical protein EOP51_15910 [Sphingobacteriales bacterium]